MNNLRHYREQAKLSARELSLVSGVALATIYKIEKGVIPITECKLSTLVKLAKPLKCKVKDLVVEISIKRKL